MGDFNIDLLKCDSKEYINYFYNSMSSHFFSPFILQPTRPISKTLIDNIFFNTLEYKSTSGNLTIQLADHLFQLIIVEGFFKELPIPKKNIFRCNFKNFNEREFQEALDNICWNDISSNNFYDQINYLLDEFAPYKKLSKKLIKLETKPWVNIMIQQQMHKRDKLLHDYFKESNHGLI